MAWAKKRAGEYLDRGDLRGALASFTSDLNKHDETAGVLRSPPGAQLLPLGMNLALVRSDGPGLRKWIEGFA